MALPVTVRAASKAAGRRVKLRARFVNPREIVSRELVAHDGDGSGA